MILWLTEYTRFARDQRGFVAPVGMEPALREQIILFDEPNGAEPFHSETAVIRLIADHDFHLAFNEDATDISRFYKGGEEYYLGLDTDMKGPYRLFVHG